MHANGYAVQPLDPAVYKWPACGEHIQGFLGLTMPWHNVCQLANYRRLAKALMKRR
jgi:hypothetical protein